MTKKILAALAVLTILLSLCACGEQEAPGKETEQTTTTALTEPTDAPAYPTLLSYEAYMKMTPAQQQAYYETFPDAETYMQWFNNAAIAHNQGNSGTTDKVDGDVGQITQPTEPQQQPTQDPTEPTQKPTTGAQEDKDPVLLTYEEYLELSPALQQAYCESFSSMDAYMQWFNEAVKEYNNNKNDNSTQVEGNEGQITQPTEETTDPTQSTEGTEFPGGQVGGLEGSASQGEVDF